MGQASRNETVEVPVFLVGSERSGTALLRLMLDSHPEIAFNLESEYMVTRMKDDGGFPDMTLYREWLAGDRVFRHSRFSVDPALDYVGLMNSFLVQKRGQKRFVGATVHYHFSRLKHIWPQAKFIYLLRDGRDVASSVVQMGWAGNCYAAADLWIEAEREWAAFRPGLSDDRWLEVRYEDLTANHEAVLQSICAFIGTAYTPAMLDYVGHSTYDVPDPSYNYKWKTKYPAGQLDLVQRKLAPMLAQRGYEVPESAFAAVPGMVDWRLRLESKIRHVGFRLQRYGAWSILGSKLSRLVGLADAERHFRQRMDLVDDQLLK